MGRHLGPFTGQTLLKAVKLGQHGCAIRPVPIVLGNLSDFWRLEQLFATSSGKFCLSEQFLSKT